MPEAARLAQFAGQTVAAAAITDAWEGARGRFARLLGGGDAKKIQVAERWLAETHEQLTAAAGADVELVRVTQAQRWQDRFADLLDEDPGVAADLRALVEEIAVALSAGAVSAADHSLVAGGDVNITASGGGVAAGATPGGGSAQGSGRWLSDLANNVSAGILVFLVTISVHPFLRESLWIFLFVLAALLLVIQLIRLHRHWSEGASVVAVGSVILIALTFFFTTIGPYYSMSIVRPNVEVLVDRYSWIAYDPAQFNPNSPRQPTESEISTELHWIRRAGFGGVITFGSDGVLSSIPRLAKRIGLKVIMGIWNPGDSAEVAAAIAQHAQVDAYCVGHDELGKLYSFATLQSVINKVRFDTRLPVTTTEPLQEYLANPSLIEVGDWLFPDVHLAFRQSMTSLDYSANVSRDVEETFREAEELASATRASGKPILLNMVAYPAGGIPGASPATQADYFTHVLDVRRDPQGPLPQNVAIAVGTAFDEPWKTGYPFYPWDPYTGLFDSTGRPRPAVAQIVSRIP